MKEKARFLGLDVHAETIAVAVAEPDGEVRSLGTVAKLAESIRKLVRKLGPAEHLRACYEAGPTGYVLYWQLAELGVKCEVIAPTPVPVKAGGPHGQVLVGGVGCRRPGGAPGAGHRGGGQAGLARVTGSCQGLTGIARHRADFGGNDCGGVGQHLPL